MAGRPMTASFGARLNSLAATGKRSSRKQKTRARKISNPPKEARLTNGERRLITYLLTDLNAMRLRFSHHLPHLLSDLPDVQQTASLSAWSHLEADLTALSALL